MLPAFLLSVVRRLSLLLPALAVCLWLLAASWAAAQTTASYTLLHTFSAESDQGVNTEGDGAEHLTQGTDGNFYGADYYGGAYTNGTIIKVTPAGVVTTLYTFSAFTSSTDFDDGINADGGSPGGGLLLGSDGNFYGTTGYGGATGSGTIFKVTPAGVLTVLHTFDARVGTDGNNVEGYASSSLIKGGDGNFYGANYFGGASGNGTVYRVTPTGTVTVLHTFSASTTNDEQNEVNTDGVYPQGLVLSSDGNFYGTTFEGGANGTGTVFKITTDGALTTLKVFDAYVTGSASLSNASGAQPTSVPTQGNDGNFYGVTLAGGAAGQGTVYKITPAGGLTTLHDFTATGDNGVNADGSTVYEGLTKGSDGSFYGTTSQGGSGGSGVVYRITPAGAFAVIYNFSAVSDPADYAGTNADGAYPEGLIFGTDGSLYGTTFLGGINGSGTIYKLTLNTAVSSFFSGETALSNGVYYLSFPNGQYFGYYSYLTDPHYIYHFDLGYEYIFDAADGKGGVYFYDFKSSTFFYTSPVFPFPYLYDFTLNTVLYYYPDPSNAGHYNTNGYRFFYRFDNGRIFTK